MQTGQDQLKIKDSYLGIVRRFRVILSHGGTRNSLLLLEVVQKQNIEPLHKEPVNLSS